MVTASIAHRDRSSSPRVPSSSRPAVELGPHPGLAPPGEATAGCRPRRAERRCGHCCQVHPDVATHTIAASLPTAVPTPPTALRPRRGFRHHLLQRPPQLVRHQRLNDAYRDRGLLNRAEWDDLLGSENRWLSVFPAGTILG